ncbi:MAG: hypothetical protein ACNA7J_04640 [Wenzhouxiangella sp.]
MASYWPSIADGLLPSAVIVDLGTCNGAIARLFASMAAERKAVWQILGLDLAEIAELDPSISFHPAARGGLRADRIRRVA